MFLADLSRVSLLNSDVEDINSLLGELTGRQWQYNRFDLKRLAKQRRFYMVVAVESMRFVGLGCLKIDDTRWLTQNYTKGYIGDIVVNENFWGRGIGPAIMKELLRRAKECNCTQVNLTSNPSNPKRAAAIKMYEKLGFQKIGELNRSNYYRLDLKS
ncbi:MAG: hypothetical protein A3B91_04080 [Candidatus Yanofskybacteria bacterium RIFCSPHIGHO2_02_FULL_41_29]|uniref:N-acetyltransferase domain-containing protein n=1 Tax=Candidatus Yanofskybacteria bacterium RIFCSPHIGHO2_01_FULL_41_53 TaxID=1802663 RepID=A0A1F8EH21_9BACT|nr:MAG: hypothetical protein A2650_03035 [Candidatus Yanofskybacteria bacterium RIFCSPHIGHO2_01_FULL_41_53]OGN10480.1 MAG: hypothetical protein A3B91_04080 [Candidatus Yanofskybacteria bacterium RIFCSPHIGHO2_02_FULL_41_29]OGN29667.1 MAG: hypothetical protein A3H54_02780 [Candidatus Yanofskybacteria bacterium RIFCSPLOWO2_02_FULL_41_13]